MYVGPKKRRLAMKAMEHWMKFTCLRFERRTQNDSDYILFIESQG